MEIEAMLDEGDRIIWRGKPVKLLFIWGKGVFRMLFGIPFVLFSLVWVLVTGLSVVALFMSCFGFPFILIGLSMLCSPLWNFLAYKNTEYILANKRVIVSGGIVGKDFKSIDFDKIQNIAVEVGIVDKIFNRNTGTIKIFSGEVRSTKNGYMDHTDNLYFVENPYEIYKLIKKVSFDIKTDIEYPNELRPEINSGYRTEYTPDK
jgi:hypothetical protein